jgi:[acyl-carrier-protein] S-malonyltransferase
MKLCFLFPGQGAQYPGMGKDLWEANSKVKELFELASDKTGVNMQKLLFEGTEAELKVTDKTQIAITLVNLSASLVLKERGSKPAGCAGFSLGEYAALNEAGVISNDDIFSIVKARGDIMEKTSRKLDSPSGNPGMAAVMGLTLDKILDTFKAKNINNAFAANYNSPEQISISGTFDGLNAAEAALKEAGAKRFIKLQVSGPFHCPLLSEAGEKLKEVVGKFTFKDPVMPVYSNVTGKLIASGAEAKDLCISQITSTVLWVEEEKSLVAAGFDRFVEAGPGKVLSGFLKQVAKETPCFLAGKFEEIQVINL